MPGWQTLTNTPSFSIDTMLLLTDASIMCHEYETSNWHRLVPDAKGNYVNGSWHSMTPLRQRPDLAKRSRGRATLLRLSSAQRRPCFCGWRRIQCDEPGGSPHGRTLRSRSGFMGRGVSAARATVGRGSPPSPFVVTRTKMSRPAPG